MGLRWEGFDEVLAELEAVGDRIADGAKGSLGLAIDHIAGVSRQLVPLETAALVGSQKVLVDGYTASISYGTPYARAQHFRLDYRHEHGQALYLEQPIRTEKDTAVGIIAHGAWAAA
jgi:hypothetical protein